MSLQKRKRYKRKDRLKAAKKWIPTYTGKSLVTGYCRWFGTNKVCAIQELEILGHEIDKDYKARISREYELKCQAAKKAKENNDEELFDSNQNSEFYYIAGYTSGGAPYGITWEQYEKEIKEENESSTQKEQEFDLDDEIPF